MRERKAGRPGRSVAFLGGDGEEFRRALEAPNNTERLLAAAFVWSRDNLLRAFPPIEGRPSAQQLGELGLVIRGAVLRSLRRQYSRDTRDDSNLLRGYPEDAYALAEQTRAIVEDWWARDVAANPSRSLDERIAKLAGALQHPPSRQGHSGPESELSQLRYLAAVEDALDRLEKRRGSRYSHEELEDLFGRLTATQYRSLRSLRRLDLACRFASKTVTPHKSPRRIRDLLPKLRALAESLEDPLAFVWGRNT